MGPNNKTIIKKNTICKAEGGLRLKNVIKESQPGKPLISVITVVYNGVGHIEKTIKSVLCQKYENYEFIIIDGMSNDGSLDIIKKYDDKIDLWLSESDNGIYHAMNKGLDLARGDYIFFLGSDDILITIPENSLRSVGLLLCNIYCGEWLFRHPHKKLLSKRMKYRNNIHPQGTFYKRTPIRYNTRYRLCADYLFNLEYLSTGMDIGYSDCIASRFSVDGASSKWGAKREIINIAHEYNGTFSMIKSLVYHLYSHLRSYKF